MADDDIGQGDVPMKEIFLERRVIINSSYSSCFIYIGEHIDSLLTVEFLGLGY